MTVGSLPRGIVNIASIDVMEARIRCDPSCFAQCLGRCRRSIGQFPVWMKGREVDRHVGPETIHHGWKNSIRGSGEIYPALTATVLMPHSRQACATSTAYSRKMTGSL